MPNCWQLYLWLSRIGCVVVCWSSLHCSFSRILGWHFFCLLKCTTNGLAQFFTCYIRYVTSDNRFTTLNGPVHHLWSFFDFLCGTILICQPRTAPHGFSCCTVLFAFLAFLSEIYVQIWTPWSMIVVVLWHSHHSWLYVVLLYLTSGQLGFWPVFQTWDRREWSRYARVICHACFVDIALSHTQVASILRSVRFQLWPSCS